MTLHKELQELKTVIDIKNGALFQKYFVEPVYREVEKLKDAYDCESLRELATVKGKKQGLTFFIKLLKQIDEDFKVKELESHIE